MDHYRSLATRSILAAIGLFLLWSPSTTQAQPGNQSMDELRAQMEQITAQMQRLEQASPETDSPPIHVDRVRSLGSQRSTKPVIQDETRYLKLYDLSDIFSFSTQYPAQLIEPFAGADSQPFNSGVDFSATSSRSGMSAGSFGGGMGGGGMGGMGGGGVFNIPPTIQDADTLDRSDIQVSIKTVIEAIKTNVEPDQWQGKTNDSTISQLGNMLLVSATNSTHSQIAALLDLFREKWGARRTIAMHVYWIRADVDSVTKLLDEEFQTTNGAGVIAADRWDPFFAKALTEKRLAYTSSIAGHNGQTLHAISGKHLSLTVDSAALYHETTTSQMLDEEESNGATGQAITATVAGLIPERRYLFTGAIAELTPLATRGGNFAIIDLKTAVTELLPPTADAKPLESSVRTLDGQTLTVALDDCDVSCYRMSTTLRCPTSQIVLAGGMTGTTDRAESQLELFVFVRATTHAIHEDASDRQPEKVK